MRIVPAVDIRGGLCVNLVQGDYGQETVFSLDPVAQAQIWWNALGEGIIHIVDLDGAKAGRCQVAGQLRGLAQARIPFEVGGGVRDLDAIRGIIETGAARVILGTAAYQDPKLLEEACAAWPGKIVAGIDAREGKVALSGWLEDTGADAIAFAKTVEAAGAARIIYTDILSDGMMNGPNYEATAALAQAVSIPVTLSGGVASLDNVRAAAGLAADGVDEIIIGRALYLDKFTVQEAVAATQAAVRG